MTDGFLIINAIFFGLLCLVWTLQFFFGSNGVPFKVVPLWLASFVWAAFCITQVVGI